MSRSVRSTLTIALVCGAMLIGFELAQPQLAARHLLGKFEDGWEHHWMERKFADEPTRYNVVKEKDDLVLMAQSRNAASGLWHMLDIHPGDKGTISWRWKVEASLSKNTKETKKEGDDYAARVFVVFEPRFLSWRTRALCYVWAAHEKVGSVYKNPYAKSVGTFVLQSGDERSDQWITESRDYIADYEAFFGESPEMVSAVAIMTDTDNTGGKATAWFDDIVLGH